MSFPDIPDELLKAIDQHFPLRCPRLDQSDRQIWVEVGQRQVVEFLQSHFKSQQENPHVHGVLAKGT